MTPVRLPRSLLRSVQDQTTIARPAEEVWDFYRDFQNIPRIVGDVTAVRRLGESHYRWRVELPFGLHTGMTIDVQEATPGLLHYRALVGSVTTAEWRLSFEERGTRATQVTERLRGPFGPPFSLALSLMGKHPQREVQDNLRRLKAVMENEPPPA